jgi:RES domain-containing protein
MGRDLRDLPTIDLRDAIAWRYSNYDTPFWARANTRDGRWNAAGEASVQYLAMEPNGAWAELIRAEELRSEDEVATVRMPLWVAAVNEVVVDYSTFDKAEAAGFAPAALIEDDWMRCQEEGRRLRTLGYGGVITPSAALPGGQNIAIFGARILWEWRRPRVLAATVPATVAAIGSPPAGLVERVRYFDDAHAGFTEYERIKAVRPKTSRLRRKPKPPR